MCDDLVPVDDARVPEEFPIEILFCSRCRTAHQRYQVPKQDLFPDEYHYRSRSTDDVLRGMQGLVARCEDRFGGLRDRLVVDVGCNDGSLLSMFRNRGARTCGIEPTGAAADARDAGHDVYHDFLTPELADELVAEKGQPDLITFTNVFAHIEDLPLLLESLRSLMSKRTIVVIENHYLGAILARNQFDTFYHEHPRTYSLTSFLFIAESLGAQLLLVEFPSRYGGNIRVFLGDPDVWSPDSGPGETGPIVAREAGFLDSFHAMEGSIERWRSTKQQLITDLAARMGPLPAKAFPGRAAILVRLLGLDIDQVARVYEKPGSMKIGHYLPGTRIPIVSDELMASMGDLSKPMLNMAWHISDEIREYLPHLGHTGPVIDIVAEQDFA